MATTVANIHRDQEHTVYIGRPSAWQNRYSHLPSKASDVIYVATRTEAVKRHRMDLAEDPEMIALIQSELKGESLGCFCAPAPCHGHTLARVAEFATVEEAQEWLRSPDAQLDGVFYIES
jgi:hypothetical protein